MAPLLKHKLVYEMTTSLASELVALYTTVNAFIEAYEKDNHIVMDSATRHMTSVVCRLCSVYSKLLEITGG